MLSELRPWGTTVCVIAGRITQEQNHRVGCFQLRPRELLSETVAVRMGHRLGGSSQQRGRGRGLSGRSRSEQGRETLNGVKGEAWAGVSACYCRSGSVSRSLCPTPTLCDPMDYSPPVSSFLGIYIYVYIYILGLRASQVVLVVKNPPANSGGQKRHRFNPYSGQEDPWRRAWQPTPVFLSGESQGQRSLVGYSPQGCTESDQTEAT